MHHLPLAKTIKGQFSKYSHIIYFASLFTSPPKREPEGREHCNPVSLSVIITRKLYIRSESFLGKVVSTLDPVPLKDDPGPNYKSIIFCDIFGNIFRHTSKTFYQLTRNRICDFHLYLERKACSFHFSTTYRQDYSPVSGNVFFSNCKSLFFKL